MDGVLPPSVNDATMPLLFHKSMEQMGKMLWQIVATIASNDPENGDIFFAKWDIKMVSGS